VTGIGGAAQSAPSFPTFDLWDGNAVTVDIAEPCWLYAGRITELDSGDSWRFVYRSTGLRAADPMYQRLLNYLGGAVQIDAKTAVDPEMVLGHAELAFYEPHSDLVEHG
jgi:hypothetical protein